MQYQSCLALGGAENPSTIYVTIGRRGGKNEGENFGEYFVYKESCQGIVPLQ